MNTRGPSWWAVALVAAQIFACASDDSGAPQEGASGAGGMTGASGGTSSTGAVTGSGGAVSGGTGTAGTASGSGGGAVLPEDAGGGAIADAIGAADSPRDAGGTTNDVIGAADVARDTTSDAVTADVPSTTLPPGIPAGYKLLLDQPFTSPGSLSAILAGNPQDWTHGTDDGGYLQYGGVGYTPPNPPGSEVFTSFALVSTMKFGSFVLDVDLMQRNPQVAPQVDMCIVFGIGSETQYYQGHIAQGHTDRWHNIHIINNALRRPITLTDNGGVTWGVNLWHKFRVVRDVATGSIQIFMDGNLTAPILTATDTTFQEGYVGFGTHQDSGRIRNLKVWGTAATAVPAPANFFTPR